MRFLCCRIFRSDETEVTERVVYVISSLISFGKVYVVGVTAGGCCSGSWLHPMRQSTALLGLWLFWHKRPFEIDPE